MITQMIEFEIGKLHIRYDLISEWEDVSKENDPPLIKYYYVGSDHPRWLRGENAIAFLNLADRYVKTMTRTGE